MYMVPGRVPGLGLQAGVPGYGAGHGSSSCAGSGSCIYDSRYAVVQCMQRSNLDFIHALQLHAHSTGHATLVQRTTGECTTYFLKSKFRTD